MNEKQSDAIMKAMDDAAIEAQNDLTNFEIDEAEFAKVVAWWQKWYLTAGYKRLGKILRGGL